MKRTKIVMFFALLSASLLATLAQAAPVLLAEFGRDLRQPLRFPFPGVQFGWDIRGVSSPWSIPILTRHGDTTVTNVPVGTVFTATGVLPQPVKMDADWSCNNCYRVDSPYDDKSFTADELFAGLTGEPHGLFGHAYVSQLGPGFTGYQVTKAELTVTEATLDWGMIVRLYGETTVPEPATLSLLTTACVGAFMMRHRRLDSLARYRALLATQRWRPLYRKQCFFGVIFD